MSRYTPTERIGVNEVERISLHELGWIFREQPIEDMGIDAHLERVVEGKPDGKLLALQIKTGISHFREKEDSYTYYGKIVHLDYWTGHSLPVVLVAHLPEKKQTLWQIVNESTAERTSKGWKVEIPKFNVFGESSATALAKLFEGTPEQQKFRKLAIDEPLMRHIEQGGKVSLALEEWINKSLGRTPVEVYIYDKSGEEILAKEWFQYYTGFSVAELATALFPWCHPVIDEDFYDENRDDYGEEDWREALMRAIDEDNGISYTEDPDAIYPYTEAAGEVEYYRLELKLNELGKAFLVVSDYIVGK
ncbi:protein of unknown function [Azotobacter beijerinckii]|uniref:DUF4365 domain-containing protein n=1 Tax=Azotobacter beijerinckii TaxID=170623 RepID=A0A1H6WPJ2_9GAMM|nr:DUF4365 domain-containing protein [Azotobacter beijerinckii]SEJ14285.1 protein of unknown function [Azotobacter beijerinckii]